MGILNRNVHNKMSSGNTKRNHENKSQERGEHYEKSGKSDERAAKPCIS